MQKRTVYGNASRIDINSGSGTVEVQLTANSSTFWGSVSKKEFIDLVKSAGITSEDLREPNNVEKIEAMKVGQRFKYGAAIGYMKISDTHVVQVYKDGGGAVLSIREFVNTKQDITIEED